MGLRSADSNSFGALAYPTPEDAHQAQLILLQLADNEEIKLHDAAIVHKTEAGDIQLEQTTELSPKTGAIAGGSIGVLLGLAIGGPIGAAALGALAGTAAGLFDTGIANKHLKELGEALEPGQAALCVLVKEANWELLSERMQPLGGHILEAHLTDEAVEGLEQAHAAQRAAQLAAEPNDANIDTAS